jgi:hypothetical protein
MLLAIWPVGRIKTNYLSHEFYVRVRVEVRVEVGFIIGTFVAQLILL